MNNIFKEIQKRQNLSFLDKFHNKDIHVYAFGGLLRDIYLKQEWEDVDIRVVIPKPRKERENILEKLLEEYNLEGKTVIEDLNLTVYRFLPAGSISQESIDLSLVSSLDDNLPDFTINSLFFDLKEKKLIDRYAGISDLDTKVIRTIKTPQEHFKQEPHMMFRAIKFACQLNFEIEEETLKAIKLNSYEIQNTFNFIKEQKSGIFVELFLGNLFKGLKSNPLKYFELLNKTNLYYEFVKFISSDSILRKEIEEKDLGSYEKNLSYLFSEIANSIKTNNKEKVFWQVIDDLAISTPKNYSDFNINIKELSYIE